MPKIVSVGGPLMKNMPEVGKMYWRQRKVTLRSQDEIRLSVPIRFEDSGTLALYEEFLMPLWLEYAKTGKGDINEKNFATLEHLSIVGRLIESIKYKLNKRYGNLLPAIMRVEQEPDPWCIMKNTNDAAGYIFNFRLIIPRDGLNRYSYVMFPKEMLADL